MCHQTVGLVQAEIERRGIVTASVTVMPDITSKVGISRALVVPFGLGRPFGPPGDALTRDAVLRLLLTLCARSDAPIVETYASGSALSGSR